MAESKVRCYIDNEKTKEIEKVFYSKDIMGEGITVYSTPVMKNDSVVKELWSCNKEFARIKAMWQLCEVMFKENDFKAACMAYKYILPRLEIFLRYISKGMRYGYKVTQLGKNEVEVEYRLIEDKINNIEQKAVYVWASERSPMAKWLKEDGSVDNKQNLEYLYSVIRKRLMAIAARYFIHWNIQYLELEKSKKSYTSRKRVLRSAVWWFNCLLLKKFGLKMPDAPEEITDIQPRQIVFSTMPSSGKSFLCNTTNEMFSVLCMIIQQKGGVLRISNEQGNIFRQSRQTMGLITNRMVLDIYPELNEYVGKTGVFAPFNKASEEEWGLKGCYFEPCTSIFKTRDSAINSVRCQLGMFDDPSRGLQECNNAEIHKKITTLFNGDFMDRFEDQDDMAIILTGTMFNPSDVFSTEIQYALEGGYYVDKRFNNTFISKKKDIIVILNDCEDEYGNSAFPEFISNEDLERKRRSLPKYEYHCIWRQKPIPADGLLFSSDYLQFYDKLPETLSTYAFATLDPTRRRPQDYLSMPILRYNPENNLYYLVDIIYKQKSILNLYDEVIKKIQMHGIINLWFEENTDTSLGTVLNMKLKELNNGTEKWCKLNEVWASKNKIERITHFSDAIIKNIVFPSKLAAPTTTQLGFAVHQLQQFDGTKNTGHDDFPDSLAMFADKQIVNNIKRNIVKGSSRLPF